MSWKYLLDDIDLRERLTCFAGGACAYALLHGEATNNDREVITGAVLLGIYTCVNWAWDEYNLRQWERRDLRDEREDLSGRVR